MTGLNRQSEPTGTCGLYEMSFLNCGRQAPRTGEKLSGLSRSPWHRSSTLVRLSPMEGPSPPPASRLPGHRSCLHRQRGPCTPQGGGAAQDGGGPGLQHHGGQGTELAHLHLPRHPWGRGRPPRRPQAWGPAVVGEWCGEWEAGTGLGSKSVLVF